MDGCVAHKLKKIKKYANTCKNGRIIFPTLCSQLHVPIYVGIGSFEEALLDLGWVTRYSQ
jgi:hypothetical protein